MLKEGKLSDRFRVEYRFREGQKGIDRMLRGTLGEMTPKITNFGFHMGTS